MSGISTALVIVAVVALVLVRQFQAQRIDTDKRWWMLPALLAFLALREPDLLDGHRPVAALALLVVEIVVGALMGFGWGMSTRVWRDDVGSVWAKGTRATAAVWIGGLALRAGLYAVGAALGLKQGSSALLLALAATLLIRSGVQIRRAAAATPLAPAAPPAATPAPRHDSAARAGAAEAAYRVDVPPTAGKDRV